MDYYKQVLHLSLERFSQPDLAKIGRCDYDFSDVYVVQRTCKSVVHAASFNCIFRALYVLMNAVSSCLPPAESGSHDDMSRLIQLVLGIAINCEHKDSEWSAFLVTLSLALKPYLYL